MTDAAPRPVVFLGPSLPLDEAREICDADYRPPVAQGDLLRAAVDSPPAIAMIDGVFKDVPTVRHREILWVMASGIPVFGASSMGALRAAELDVAGMIGVGLIYRWYRRFPLLPDDAVAVTHAPPELGSVPLSHALVDMRRWLRAALRKGQITVAEHDRAVKKAASLPFADRKMPDAGYFRPLLPSQKSKDARALLARLAGHQTRRDWPRPKTAAVPVVHAWLDDLADAGIDPEFYTKPLRKK